VSTKAVVASAMPTSISTSRSPRERPLEMITEAEVAIRTQPIAGSSYLGWV
jgi:hypothetical protein